jgi:uncharacterized protein (TIGR02996 family)
MSDEDALLAAIAAHPEEDTTRLAYADWLDEHDQPIRAEFIRVQVAVQALAELPAVEQGKQIHLFRRQQGILDDHLPDLIGPLANDLGYFDVNFDRGFLAELKLDASQLVKHAAAIRALKPLPEITVRDVAWWLLHEEDLKGALQLATTIEMQTEKRDEPVAIGLEGIRRFAARGPWRRLRSLALQRCGIGDEGITLVSGNDVLDPFPALIDLDLTANGLSVEGIRTLTSSPLWPRLRKLSLRGNSIADAAGVLVPASATSGLEYLDLRGTSTPPSAHSVLLRNYGGRVALF